ncbi:JAB domain-containing protein [uncultured Sphingomonas sp.]|uniref:JAB domain-containing protein n=1 Tax=uncultured Sphingomonas sp. TaxID=158754 RepID=UPI0025DD709A|nr:JAB domain-containing protein [uncultured Sphingomonas sp.]
MGLFADLFDGLTHERLCLAFLNRHARLLGLRLMSDASASAVDLPLPRIFEEAFRLRASGLIVAHNHPSGDPEPSAADRAATRRLADVARALDFHLIDHLIFAGDRVSSFRALGLL